MTVAFLSRPRPAAPVVRRIIGALLVGAAIFTAGCSTIRLAYEGMPSLAYYWANGYVSLNEAQAEHARQGLSELHQWHRQQELPLYADLLERAAQLAPGEISADEACTLYAGMRERISALGSRAVPIIASLAPQLTPAQVQRLARKYADNNRKYREEWIDVTPQQRRERRFEAVLKRSEDFYGRLSAGQRDTVRALVDASVFEPSVILAERIRRQEDALRVIAELRESSPSPEQARSRVRDWLARGLESPDPAYRAYETRLRAESCRIFAQAHATATPAQRERARQKLLSYRQDVTELAAR